MPVEQDTYKKSPSGLISEVATCSAKVEGEDALKTSAVLLSTKVESPKQPQLNRFSRMSKEELSKMNSKKRPVPEDAHPQFKKPFTKCVNCFYVNSCPKAYEEAETTREKGRKWKAKGSTEVKWQRMLDFKDEDSRCIYEMIDRRGGKRKMIQDYKAFVSMDTTDLLIKLQQLFKKIETLADKDPSYAKYAGLYYMLSNLYKEKKSSHGGGVNINVGNGNPTMDIQMMMKEMRKEKAQDGKEKITLKETVTTIKGQQEKEKAKTREEEMVTT